MKADLSPADLRDWICDRLDPLEAQVASTRGVRSDFDLNGGHPAGNAVAFKPAAVLVALVERPEGLGVILTRRSDSLRSHTGQVAFPGGRQDPGETPWDAALRESEEEIGLARRYVTLAGLATPYRTGSGYHITPVVGFVRPGFTLTANPHEVAEIFEPPFAWLMDPANLEQRQGKTPAGDRRHFYALTWEGQFIWGATAGMLRALHDRLYGAPA